MARGDRVGYLYVCSFGVVNCKVCQTADNKLALKEAIKKLKADRAEAYRFRNSPRLIIVKPPDATPPAPAPPIERTVEEAIAEDIDWDDWDDAPDEPIMPEPEPIEEPTQYDVEVAVRYRDYPELLESLLDRPHQISDCQTAYAKDVTTTAVLLERNLADHYSSN